MLQTIPGDALSLVGYANVRDTAAINKMIYGSLAKQILPSDLSFFGALSQKTDSIRRMYMVFML